MGPTVIVVVEDEPHARLGAVDACERAGFEVADFGRADDALAHVRRMPDSVMAVLTDVDVPGDQDGIDLASAIRRQWPRIPVTVTSGRFGQERPPGLPDGVGFLAKPWTPATLMGCIRASLAASPVPPVATPA